MRHADRIRQEIAREAARLMYEEGVREYRDAKRKAARRFGPPDASALGSHLPANAEIHAELARLIELHEGRLLPERLLQRRLLALRQMELLAPFFPLLVGSVLSGLVTVRSDIDLHLFADDVAEVEAYLAARGIPCRLEVVSVRHGSEFREYPHLYLEDDGVEIECTVYPPQERRRRPKSSITGRPMQRANIARLRRLIAAMVGKEGDTRGE